jgi:hypothetical protein
MAAQQSQIVTDRMFLQLYIALGVLFALLILYRLFAYFLARRLKAVQTTAAKQAHNGEENGHPVAPLPSQNQPSIARQTEVTP